MAILPLWNETSSHWVKVAIATAGLVTVAGAEWARRRAGAAAPILAGKVLQVLGVLGLLAYFNFGSFHFGGIYVHLWDSAHYVLGAKYFDEVGYEELYECIVLLDAEQSHNPEHVAHRVLTDLHTNRSIAASDILEHPDRCRARFSPARWQAFAADVAFFRDRFPIADWENLPRDHGFNASPAWLLVAHSLAGGGALTWNRILVLASIDPLLIAGAFVAVAWAFGGWTAALVAIVFGAYFPGRLWWTGGSFLRWDWFAALLVGLSLCRRERNLAGGALIGYAGLVRVFPAFALMGAALAIAMSFLQRRSPNRGTLRLLAGALVATILLVPMSGLLRRDHAWGDFSRNLAKHASVPSPNRMGLPALLAVGSTEISADARSTVGVSDARTQWEYAQADTLQRRRWLWIVLAAAGTLLVAAAVRQQPTWVACVLGLLLASLGPALACYYYVFVAALALLGARRAEVGAILLALTVASGVVARISGYDVDRQYAAQSLLVLLVFPFIVTSFTGAGRPANDEALDAPDPQSTP